MPDRFAPRTGEAPIRIRALQALPYPTQERSATSGAGPLQPVFTNSLQFFNILYVTSGSHPSLFPREHNEGSPVATKAQGSACKQEVPPWLRSVVSFSPSPR